MSVSAIEKHAHRAAKHAMNQPGPYRRALTPFYDALQVAGDVRSDDPRVWRLVGYAFEEAVAPLVRKGLRITA